MNRPVVSVFGGSTPAAGMPAYEEARRLGGLLARAGFAVATGGYRGVMEAASRGAAEAGGHVIGVTTDALVQLTGGQVNGWVSETINYPTLRESLSHLVEHCDAAIAMPGGIGTLSEVALTWSLLQTAEISVKPFVLVGQTWETVLRDFFQGSQAYIHEKHWQLLTFAPTAEAAAEVVAQALQGQAAP